MLIRPLDKEPFDTQMCQNCQSGLGVAERVSRNGSFGRVIELVFQKAEPSLKVLNDIVIISATLIMFDKSSTNDFPVLGLQKASHFCFRLLVLLVVPFLKKSHLAVEK